MKRDSRGRFMKLEVKMDAGVVSKEEKVQEESGGAEKREVTAAKPMSGRRKKAARPKKDTVETGCDVPTAEEFRVRAKGLAVQALERLGEIALDEESAAQHAIPAGKAIIEYAYGKPLPERSTDADGMARVDEMIDSITEAAQEE